MTAAQLEAAITPKTKMLWYSSPCNPSGSVYSREELEAIAEVLKKHPKIIVVSDEIYEHINFTSGGHISIAEIDGMYERTVTVNGVSKAFAMTGWRMGYIGAPEWLARACNKMQGQITSGANSIAQRATIAALNAPVSKIQFMIDEFHKRRDLILSLLGEIEGFKLNVPEGAFYVFPDISSFFGKTIKGKKIENASDFSLFLLEEANVATVTGEAFGDDDCIRISYAASNDEIKEAVRRIKEALS
jgi:aspartate aminotransferase